MPEPDHLSRIGWISIERTTQRRIGSFDLDPAILLPVELPPGQTSWDTAELGWEAIVAGALVVLAHDTANPHADYYRQFVLAVKPDIRGELTHLGVLKARNGDHDLAIEVFRSLEGLFPDSAEAKMHLAIALEGKGRRCEALSRSTEADEYQGLAFEAYKRALAADPSLPAIHYNAAFFYLHQRSFDKAREHLAVYAASGDDPDRVREARKIIGEIDAQGLVDGMFQKAFDLIRMGREQEGIEAARRFLDAHPDFANGWFLLGWGLRRLARYPEARDAFLRSLGLGAPHPDLLNELAICHMELGELEQGEKRLREALRIEPENTKIISNLGVIALKRGRPDEARGYFLTVREIDPEDPVAARYLDGGDAASASDREAPRGGNPGPGDLPAGRKPGKK